MLTSTLSENIAKYRCYAGLTQVAFARRLGVSKQCVSNWEHDNVVPSVEMLCKIADYFSISVDTLIGRSDSAHLDVNGLTEEQVMHLRMMVYDLRTANVQKGDSHVQMETI